MTAAREARIAAFERLVETVARLRRECPWDREQTPRSILPYLIEEAYEALEAIDAGDADEARSELGDLLLQIVLHSEMGSETGAYDLTQVMQAVTEKMIRRHPHVFGDLELRSAGEVLQNWSRLKAAERRDRAAEDTSVLAGVPRRLPALLRGERLGEKASRIGFDWNDARAVLGKVREEIHEIEQALASGDRDAVEAEIGDCLFALASLGRKADVSVELALGRALDRFERRFRRVEALLAERGRSAHETTAAELDELWQTAKREEAALTPPERNVSKGGLKS
jgi:tetrapyrrole methylase family protein / MazG family protein